MVDDIRCVQLAVSVLGSYSCLELWFFFLFIVSVCCFHGVIKK